MVLNSRWQRTTCRACQSAAALGGLRLQGKPGRPPSIDSTFSSNVTCSAYVSATQAVVAERLHARRLLVGTDERHPPISSSSAVVKKPIFRGKW